MKPEYAKALQVCHESEMRVNVSYAPEAAVSAATRPNLDLQPVLPASEHANRLQSEGAYGRT